MLKMINTKNVSIFSSLDSMGKIIAKSLILLSLMGCAPAKYKTMNRKINAIFGSEFYDNHFMGLMVYDPETKNTLYTFNGQKYFTPASNTKIFTLYASLKLLPTNIPALKYVVKNDTLFIEGTGDPSLLHPYFKDSTAINFSKNFENVALHLNNFRTEKFGPGWAWEDYDYPYSPERSTLPMYGNTVTIHKTDSIVVSPSYFKDKVIPLKTFKNREIDQNTFYFDPLRKDTLAVPFKVDSVLLKKLWENAFQKKVSVVHTMPEGDKTTLFGIPSDSLYQRMMYESDNFIAEQLLIVASSTLSDTLNSSKVQDYVLEKYLADLKQPPRWVDGSGLSRYNLFTPESLVQVLHKMYTEIPKEQLFNLFPIGGVSGTLKNEFKGNTYIHAKSGSLGNNYCLSGYLTAKSGKTFIFSFMNNHYRKPNKEIKEQIQTILEWIWHNN